MHPPPHPCNAVGLALSGGGIRSAAFCIGAVQALAAHRALDGVDYLSTVSGGGYTGASMTAASSRGSGFPFQHPEAYRDSVGVGHVRNYSNYLLPRSRSPARNLTEAAAILLRGLLANAVLVLAVLLGLALMMNTVGPVLGARPFLFTKVAAVLLVLVLIGWSLVRSAGARASDVSGGWLATARVLLGGVVGLAIFEIQPSLLEGLTGLYAWLAGGEEKTASATTPTAVLAALGAFLGAVGAFATKLGRFLRISQTRKGGGVQAGRIAGIAVVWLAAALLPLLLLVAYLHLWAWITPEASVVPRPFDDIGRWYGWAFAVLAVTGFLFRPNAYSLHRLYRDRLSKAFLFDPAHIDPQTGEPAPLDGLKLSDVDPSKTPYPIINAAMNVQGSLAANKRGRDADFFTFGPHFVGSDLTLFAATRQPDHADTRDMEDIDPDLDLATAMAISGAAVSANMGTNTIKPLSPTLALLNVRLGYWLRNPRHLARPRRGARLFSDLGRALFGRLYLLLEMFNRLDETYGRIYLTDGGHIENLGVYQLLKRGCQLVVAIDAEADPTMSFASLTRMERYARIDLGVRIDLPWQEIAAATQEFERWPHLFMERHGPHCAIGRILYPDGQEGILLYVKSSLSGDEPDYVMAHKARQPSFPHETTGDQFFTEEQFEAYRALGFHALDRCLAGRDAVAVSAELEARDLGGSDLIDWIKATMLQVR
jgi:hypothetical protein